MSDKEIIGQEDNTGESEVQAEKTYTQKEFDDHMAKLKNSLARKYEKTFSELGDIEELRQLKTEAEKRRTEEAKKRGEFDKIIQELAQKKDEEIRKRDEIIRNYTVDLPLVNTAAQFGSVNPNQVKALLKPYVRLNDIGEPEVLDDKGTVRYSDKGQPFRVEDLVKEFLDTNPHFKAAGPSTAHSKSNVSQTKNVLDISKLDMTNPNDRKIYAEYRRANGLAR